MKKLLALFLFPLLAFGQGTPTVQVKTVADLVALPIPTVNNRLTALVVGDSTTNDLGGGIFYYSSTSTNTTNAFSVFKPLTTTGRWIRQSDRASFIEAGKPYGGVDSDFDVSYGQLFVATNTLNQIVRYAGVYGVIRTNTAASEMGSLWFQVNDAGTVVPVAHFDNDGTFIIDPSGTSYEPRGNTGARFSVEAGDNSSELLGEFVNYTDNGTEAVLSFFIKDDATNLVRVVNFTAGLADDTSGAVKGRMSVQVQDGSGAVNPAFTTIIQTTNLNFSAATKIDTTTGKLDLGNGTDTVQFNGLAYATSRMHVGDVAGTDRTLYAFRNDARTAVTYDGLLINQATSGTGSINKFGLDIISSGTWNGASSTNFGLSISAVSGGTVNFAYHNATAADEFHGTGTVLAGLLNGSGFRYSSSANALSIGDAAGPDRTFYIYRDGAKADNSYAGRFVNVSTSSTADKDKSALNVVSSGTWNGTTATNSGIHIETVSGGTVNFAINNESGADNQLGTGTSYLGGDLVNQVAGKGIQIKEGSNARMGQSALVNGTVTVSNTSVTANTRIFLTRAVRAGTTVGVLGAGTIVAATSFVIESTDLAGSLSADDDSTVNWLLIEPSP